ncbi:hypothetical protein FQN54_001806 [Arachnomyces sp. PD_36]|nr:hypothetical protein FQN54_001806 [Arachnomyces sp. PD_36]
MQYSQLLALAGCVTGSLAAYEVVQEYTSENFFSEFTLFTEADPTNGFVTYVDQATAEAEGLISTENNAIYMGVDYANTVTDGGRHSVRVSSNAAWDQGLIIGDIQHMPGSICGTWPAFWTVGPDWPNNGEIDIIEGVHDQPANAVALHTAENCRITDNGNFLGEIKTPDCFVEAPDQDNNAGCGIGSNDTTSYGDGFNQVEGGVYAAEITSEAVSVWWFPRASIPADITAGTPDPSTWSTPMAQFQGECDIPSKIQQQSIIFDTTFCGDWAGSVWDVTPTCASKADSCEAYVADNPADFEDAYWLVNSIHVYVDGGNATLSTRDESQSLKRHASHHRANLHGRHHL